MNSSAQKASGVKNEAEPRLAGRVYERFTVRVRRVGGAKGRRPALGLTIPTVVCTNLNLKIGQKVRVTIELVGKK